MSATEEGFATAQSEPEVPAPPPPPAAATTTAKGSFKPKSVKSKVTYTPEQLANFTEFEYNGETYGRNERNDVVDGDSNFRGRWNAATSKIEACPEPADWLQIFL
jgi:hypothetical protein